MDGILFFLYYVSSIVDAINKLRNGIDIPCMIHLSIENYDDGKFHLGFVSLVRIKILLKRKQLRENQIMR